MTEPNIEAKKIVKSAVKEAPSVCCYDYKVTQDHHHDWIKARQSLINNNVELGSDESDGDEIDLDKKAGLFKQKDTGSARREGEGMQDRRGERRERGGYCEGEGRRSCEGGGKGERL